MQESFYVYFAVLSRDYEISCKGSVSRLQ